MPLSLSLLFSPLLPLLRLGSFGERIHFLDLAILKLDILDLDFLKLDHDRCFGEDIAEQTQEIRMGTIKDRARTPGITPIKARYPGYLGQSIALTG